MAATEVILLQRVEKLGQMGDVVKVKPGFARNYLLPQGKAIRATAANRDRFERERSQLEAHNVKRREEAERLLERLHGLSVVIIRQAGESGNLYGSVTARDISEAAVKEGVTFSRQQVEISHPIKALGLYQVKVQLHPEVHLDAKVNVARSVEEAERQAKGEVQHVDAAETHVDASSVEHVNAEMLENAPVAEETAESAE
ncbi:MULTISPECIES: 50S ribosomal protein L9 [Commensalibacter]|uniref:Large ribosomal subunit protein bL9 n=2 Tax=Commensalibacter TaxID=1079922 RepID=W7DZY4_9PROT|nr:50S ribosomal protein L9 [Commensalibacter papalotli (ex Servin-Garciduenas et al. 2014)]CAI3937186.1 Ribosomal protein L9 (RplI) (PDB:1VS6) (PUBMED:27112601) [Commensalibacter papalotli (ex Botero et al. 2024)]CAI3938426.1 Ribosomal protein L9 (RplI) (PDB:1VS6) (PUBMED:27112601) [Commensalibacter papalotli (ex Botero et al. 2024)]